MRKSSTIHPIVYILMVAFHASDASDAYDTFVSALAIQRWDVEDEGAVSDLLNVDISVGNNEITLSQCKYIEKLVETYLPDGVPDSFTSNMVPADANLPSLVDAALSSETAPDTASIRQYQALIGSLLYCATHTRPDVAYAVALLCRAMSRPSPDLTQAARRVIYYLYRHRNLALRYPASPSPLDGYTDSDWAVRHSTSGSVFVYSSAAISWSSRKQATVALSSCEAEIVAGSEAAKEAVYLRGFIDELGLGAQDPTPLRMDNTAARDLSYNPEHHSRTKHIARRHFFIREKVESLELSVPFVRTCDNLADFFTKPLPAKSFFAFRDAIMNVAQSREQPVDAIPGT